MKRLSNSILKAVTAALTGFIVLIPLYTCVFFVHQPRLPEEINDFRKYDK